MKAIVYFTRSYCVEIQEEDKIPYFQQAYQKAAKLLNRDIDEKRISAGDFLVDDDIADESEEIDE